MATIPSSPPSTSPPPAVATAPAPQTSKSPPLPPLITSTPQPQRKPSGHRQSALLARRISSYSASHRSIPPYSRPESVVFPAFHSSLPYALVRDFAYPWTHPMHYGPPAEESASTPASESRRVSDPTLANWEDSRSQWSATPPWMAENNFSSRDQLPARAFNDDGPPYSEDEDLQSPVVTTLRHKKHKSERGRSPGAAGPHRGVVVAGQGDQMEHYHHTDSGELDGPGGEIETFSAHPLAPQHRDSNFAKPLQRQQHQQQPPNQFLSPNHQQLEPHQQGTNRLSEGEYSDEDEARYSRNYSFSIASPDEEMHGKAVALFDFESEHENELALREGQIILVSYRHGQGWLVAEDPISGESGLVPEEFVRLVRHIEGGLNGLNSLVTANGDGDTMSPISNDPGSAVTPTPPNDGFEKYSQPAVQSSFTTHTRDFSPMPRSSRDDGPGSGPGPGPDHARSQSTTQT